MVTVHGANRDFCVKNAACPFASSNKIQISQFFSHQTIVFASEPSFLPRERLRKMRPFLDEPCPLNHSENDVRRGREGRGTTGITLGCSLLVSIPCGEDGLGILHGVTENVAEELALNFRTLGMHTSGYPGPLCGWIKRFCYIHCQC